MSFSGCALGLAGNLLIQAFRLLRHPSRQHALVLPDLSEWIVRYRSNSSFVHSQHP